MNLANKLTMLRIILVPFFAFFMLAAELVPYSYLWAAILFAIASITDTIDGKVARKYNMITDFGKFLDPLADKVLVVTALICFVQLGWTSAWVVSIIVIREFMVSGVRLVAAGSEKKIVIAANIWGKLKTASTMVAICVIIGLHIFISFGLFTMESFPVQLISDILMYISCLLTAVSGIIYLYDYREIFKEAK
ncbi:MAG: CDP-diacylglycerol--glycerol-3-phosphate 3-phosphatidyltransferase [Ruminiclostridium sp.]|nr:CDP-diacylglycerol--glycerol-3-phosphate 3-phosphatidyltransferase [Ruminiclostridium sp.]